MLCVLALILTPAASAQTTLERTRSEDVFLPEEGSVLFASDADLTGLTLVLADGSAVELQALSLAYTDEVNSIEDEDTWSTQVRLVDDDGFSAVEFEVAALPRDAATGLPTGKRQHKPFSLACAEEVALESLGLAVCVF